MTSDVISISRTLAIFAHFSKILQNLMYFLTLLRVMSMIQIWIRLLAIFLLLHPLHPRRQKCLHSRVHFFNVIFLQPLYQSKLQ
jgi:hypothetical protein